MGVSFDCPCACGGRVAVGLKHPLDGGPPVEVTRGTDGHPTHWEHSGEPWETFSLSPSINSLGHWHGFVTNGFVT